jgi:hypothetical protein
MDLFDLLKLAFRRWYVSAPVLVLTLAAAVALGGSIKPEYKTSAAVLLVPPAAPAPAPHTQPTNPWLRVGEAAMAQAVQIAVSSHDSRTKIQTAGGDPAYEVRLVTRSSILTVDVRGTSSASALATVTGVTQLIRDTVAGQQAPYKPRPAELISTQVLDSGLNVTQSRSNILRVQIVVGAIGLLLAGAAAVGYDAIDRRRAIARQNERHRARSPLAWNAGKSAVGARQTVFTPGVPATTDSTALRLGGPVYRRPDDTAAHPDDTAARPRPDGHRHPPQSTAPAATSPRTPSQKSPVEHTSAPQPDDTVLLTAVRTPAEDSTP